MQKKMVYSLGIFDSGIGGFSILKEVHKLLPNIAIYYIADDEYAPYGEKDPALVTKRCVAITEMLIKNSVNTILVACNTATAVTIGHLREYFSLPFVGIEPYLNVINREKKQLEKQNIVLLMTELMQKTERFQLLQEKHDPDNTIAQYVCKNLASIIEKIFWHGLSPAHKSAIEAELKPLKNQNYTHAILGCTHYPLIASFIEKYLQIKTISPCPFVAKRVVDLGQQNGLLTDGSPQTKFQFYSTKKRESQELVYADLFCGL